MVAKRSYPTSEVRGSGLVPAYKGTGTAERSYPSPRSGVAAGRSYPTPPMPEARGGHVQIQGAVSARAQESLEELSHVEGQEGRQ